MDFDKIYNQQAPASIRRSSFMFVKDNKILSADDYFSATKNSIQNEALEAHRKRSFSAGALPVSTMAQRIKSRIPNFRKFHEQQFERMESITDYTARKAERAKKLMTPPKLVSSTGQYSPTMARQSQIPGRQSPTVNRQPTAGRQSTITGRQSPTIGRNSPTQMNSPVMKRTLSINYKHLDELPSKKFKYDTNVVKKDTTVRSTSPNPAQLNSNKPATISSLTTSWLKGVKLNKRFQLLMNYQKKV